MNLTCNPYGSSLKLHCAVTGPLDPHFFIQWYVFPDHDPEQYDALGSSRDDYQVDSNVLNVVGDIKHIRSISSVLTTGPLADTLQNQCIKCQVEFQDVELTLGSEDSIFCLSSKANYGHLDSCSDGYAVQNKTSVCASLQDVVALSASPDSLSQAASIEPSASSSQLLPSPSHPQPPIASLQNMEPTSSHLVHSSSLYLPGASTLSQPPPIQSVSVSGSSSTPPSNATSANNSQAAVKKGLFVAIGVCVLFIVIIIILMYFVVHLCRQWWWRKDKVPVDNNEDTSECLRFIRGMRVGRGNGFKSHSNVAAVASAPAQ